MYTVVTVVQCQVNVFIVNKHVPFRDTASFSQ